MAQMKKLSIALTMSFVGALAAVTGPWPGREARVVSSFTVRRAPVRGPAKKKSGKTKKARGTRENKANVADGDFIAMREAIQRDDAAAIGEILENRPDYPKQKYRFGETFLHYAALVGACESAKILAASGSDVNAENTYGRRPLHDAAHSDDHKTAELLIGEYNADVGAKLRHDSMSLPFFAAGYNDARPLLIPSGTRINVGQERGWTPLHYAAHFNAYDAAELLIKHKANIDGIDAYGRTPLHCAVGANSDKTAALLIEAKADVNAVGEYGWTPLHHVARSDAFETAQLLIGRKAQVDAKDDEGLGALHHAAKANSCKVAEALIVAGKADVNLKSPGGWTPLHYTASFPGRKEAAELLIKREANVNAQANDGKTPLHIAVWRRNSGVMEFLVGRNADVNAQDKKGQSPLHYAERENFRDGVELLLSKGANPNVADNANEGGKGWCPLIYAINAGNHEIAELLVAGEAEADWEHQGGWRPLHYAVRFRQRKMVELLIQRGANIDALNHKNKTPLDFAIDSGCDDIAALLLNCGGSTAEGMPLPTGG